MILTEYDINLFFNKTKDSQNLKTTFSQDKNSITFFTALAPNNPKRWTKYFKNGSYYIPYIFDTTIKVPEKRLILKSMNSIALHTCVKFRERTKEINYLNIQSTPSQGCFSYVGMKGGKQPLELGTEETTTCFSKRIVTHELLHAVGLYHEHMRIDRDDYVRIHRENVQEGTELQFEKVVGPGVSTYDIPYDYLSIMHYGKHFFAKDNTLVTIEPKDKRYIDLIGSLESPSSSDWLKVCEMYQCEVCNNASYKIFNTLPYILNYTFLIFLRKIFY
uniref:Metalloendopeptidase n=1 Tax=Strongyloides venezuelensis TaxID=75913 RepID=A0A0K0G0H4_STRVS